METRIKKKITDEGLDKGTFVSVSQSGAHQYSRLLTYYVSKRLEALADVNDYDAEKLTLSNLRWFLGHVDSDDVVLAKLRTMVDSDKKRKAYLSRFGVTYTCEYSEAEDRIGRECLGILQVK